MSRILFLVAILLLSSWDLAFAGCELRPVTPYAPDRPGIFEYGPIQLAIHCDGGEDISGTWIATTTNWAYGEVGRITGSGSQVMISAPPLAGEYGVEVYGDHFYAGSEDLYIGKRPLGTLSGSIARCYAYGDSTNGFTYNAILNLNGLTNADGQPLIYQTELVSAPLDSNPELVSGGSDTNFYHLYATKPGDFEVNLWGEALPYEMPSAKVAFNFTLNDQTCINSSISEVKVAQVLFDFKETENQDRFDLVAGKDFAILAKAKMNLPSQFANENVSLTAKIFSGPTEVASVNGIIPASGDTPEKTQIKVSDITSDTPVKFVFSKQRNSLLQIEGAYRVEITLSPPEGANELTGGSQKSVNVNFRRQKPIHLKYVLFDSPKDCSTCYSKVDEFQAGAFMNKSVQDINKMYPVSDYSLDGSSGIFWERVPGFFKSINLKEIASDGQNIGIARDLRDLCIYGLRGPNASSLNRTIGIVPSGYSQYHGLSFVGLTYGGTCSVLTTANNSITAAHELGHAISDLGDEYNEDDHNRYSGNTDLSGYSVLDEKEILNTAPAQCAGYGGSLHTMNIMGPAVPDSSCYWIDLKSYRSLWRDIYDGLTNKVVAIVSGAIQIDPLKREDGKKVIFDKRSFYLGNGVPTKKSAGNFSFIFRNAAGNIIGSLQTSLDIKVFMGGEPSKEIGQKLNDSEGSRYFTIQIPYSSDGERLEILEKGRVLASVSPQGELVAAAIKNLPDNAFIASPEEGRTILLTAANEFNELMMSRRYSSAAFQLNNKLAPLASNILVQTDRPDVFSVDRNELFENITDASSRISSFFSYEKNPSNGLIEAWLDKPGYQASDKALLKIRAKRLLENKDLEYAVSVFMNNIPVKVASVKDGRWTSVTPTLIAGTSNLVVKLFVQNKRLAGSLEVSIRQYEERNFEIDRVLAEETGQEIRENLLREKKENLSIIADLKSNLQSIRKPFGPDINLMLVTL